MGTKLSVSLENALIPETSPRSDRPPTFDPQYGFERPRKIREMKASWEEMEQWNLKPGQRDYCAHLLIPLMKCQTQNAPFAGHACDSERSAWDKCEYEDYIMRIKMEKLLEDCDLNCPADKQIQVYGHIWLLLLKMSIIYAFSTLWYNIDSIVRCSVKCLRSAQSRLAKKLVDVAKEPSLSGGIFLRQMLIRNPQVGELHSNTIETIILSLIDIALTSADQTIRRLSIELFSIRYGCSSSLSQKLLNTLDILLKKQFIDTEDRAGLLDLKSLGKSAMRDDLARILFEIYASSLAYAKQGDSIPNNAVLSIIERGLKENTTRIVALKMVKSLCTNSRLALLPIVTRLVSLLVSFLDSPCAELFDTLTHICLLYSSSSTLYKHLYVIFSAIKQPMDEQIYGSPSAMLLATIINTSAILLKPEVLLAVQRSICEYSIRRPKSLAYRNVLLALLSTNHEVIPVPVQQNDLPTSLSNKWSFLFHYIGQINQLTIVVLGSNRLIRLKELTKEHTLHIPPDAQKDFFGVARTVLSYGDEDEISKTMRALCDTITRPRIQNLAPIEVTLRQISWANEELQEKSEVHTSRDSFGGEERDINKEPESGEIDEYIGENAPIKQIETPPASHHIQLEEPRLTYPKELTQKRSLLPTTTALDIKDTPKKKLKRKTETAKNSTVLKEGEASVEDILSSFCPS
uniref:NADH dehydrogenase [ubiquinone] 1 beta subcomplex subunit 7 n=1 Tax=Heterorhabditis bacteriophora TaxID=37862 RepID=A0A1I7WTH4_HETBA